MCAATWTIKRDDRPTASARLVPSVVRESSEHSSELVGNWKSSNLAVQCSRFNCSPLPYESHVALTVRILVQPK